MNKRTKRLLGGMVLAVGTAGAVLIRRRKPKGASAKAKATNVWARPGMTVTFRAELMPGRDRSERSFRVAELLPSGRITLEEVAGEHAETEFEPARS